MSVENIILFHSVLDEALERLGKKNLKLKECQYEAVKAVVVDRNDTICIYTSIFPIAAYWIYLFATLAQYGRHTVFCMSITDYPRASVSFPRDRRLGKRDCLAQWLVLMELFGLRLDLTQRRHLSTALSHLWSHLSDFEHGYKMKTIPTTKKQ